MASGVARHGGQRWRTGAASASGSKGNQRQGDDDSLPNYWLAAAGKGNRVVRRVRAFTTLGELVVQVDANFAKIRAGTKNRAAEAAMTNL